MFLETTYKVVRAKLAELAAPSMKPGQDPDGYFMEAKFKRNEMTGMGEPVTDRRYTDILVQGFTDEYDAVKFQIYRDSSFGLDDLQKPCAICSTTATAKPARRSPGAALRCQHIQSLAVTATAISTPHLASQCTLNRMYATIATSRGTTRVIALN